MFYTLPKTLAIILNYTRERRPGQQILVYRIYSDNYNNRPSIGVDGSAGAESLCGGGGGGGEGVLPRRTFIWTAAFLLRRTRYTVSSADRVYRSFLVPYNILHQTPFLPTLRRRRSHETADRFGVR